MNVPQYTKGFLHAFETNRDQANPLGSHFKYFGFTLWVRELRNNKLLNIFDFKLNFKLFYQKILCDYYTNTSAARGLHKYNTRKRINLLIYKSICFKQIN